MLQLTLTGSNLQVLLMHYINITHPFFHLKKKKENEKKKKNEAKENYKTDKPFY